MPLNCKAKGNRAELALVKLFRDRFPTKPWSRSVGSGNRWAQVAALPKHAVETYTGDLTAPEGFLWVIESKCGYDHIDLGTLTNNSTLDSFLAQVGDDATRSGRKPLLCLKQSRRSWLAFLKETTLLTSPDHSINYRGWVGVPLEDLLKLEDGFWFL